MFSLYLGSELSSSLVTRRHTYDSRQNHHEILQFAEKITLCPLFVFLLKYLLCHQITCKNKVLYVGIFISEDFGNTNYIKPYYDFLLSIYPFVLGTLEMIAMLGKKMMILLYLTMDKKYEFLAHSIWLGN